MKIIHNFSKLIKQLFVVCLILLICLSSSFAQEGIRYNSTEAYKGYALCSPTLTERTYLIDNCGKIVNRWLNTSPNNYCRLTNEGNLIFIRDNQIFERDWDNNNVNVINHNDPTLFLNYEVMKLENGNYLAAARRLVDKSYFDEIGWNPYDEKSDRVDGVVEIDVNGNIVWEWNIGDHTIQDDYPSVSNYGIIKDHPELVDVHTVSTFDWQSGESFMINSIDYNPDLDQILISVRKVSEIMIIDHSTTTEEAKGSTGGNSGKGGDILYRWGNPQNYDQGTENDRVLYYQHNPNWVKYGEHKGKVIMYNNGLNRVVQDQGTFSSVHIIDTPVESDGSYVLDNNEAYEPTTPDVTIDKQTTGNNFYSGYTSGAQVLPNGNIYITVGRPSDFMEVKTDGTLVWEYNLDFSFYIFRSEKYAPDFPGFEGRDLTANGTIENPSSSYICEIYTSTKEFENLDFFAIQFDQIYGNLTIDKLQSSSNNVLEVRNAQGQILQSIKNVYQGSQTSLEHAATGLYFITLYDLKSNKRYTHKILKY